MPQAIAAAVVQYFALTGVTATIANYAIQAGIYYLAGRYLYSQIEPPNIDRPERPLSTRKQYLNEPNAPQVICYGEASFAPAIIADFSSANSYHILAAMCPHALEQEIVSIRVNDQEFFTPTELSNLNSNGQMAVLGTGTGKDGISELRDQLNERAKDADLPIMFVARDFTAPTPGNFADKAASFLNFASGLDTPQFGADDNGKPPANWKMKASGLSWVYLNFPRDSQTLRSANKQPVWHSVPTLTFRVRRNNSSLMLPEGFDGSAYTRGNTALCAYDYLKRYTDYGNAVAGIDRIDLDTFRAAALSCEPQASGPSSGRHYALTANGTISLTTPPASTLDQLGLAMNSGVFPEYAGIRSFAAGIEANFTHELDDDQIVKDTWNYSLLAPVESRVSQFLCRYTDVEGVEQSAGANYPTDETTASQELQLDLVNNAEQAENVARILISRIWNGATISFEINDNTLNIKPYDKVRVNGAGPLEISETFRVLAVERTPEGRLGLQMQYEDPNLFRFKPLSDAYLPPGRLPNVGPVATDETFRITLNGTQNRLLVRKAGSAADDFLNYR